MLFLGEIFLKWCMFIVVKLEGEEKYENNYKDQLVSIGRDNY